MAKQNYDSDKKGLEKKIGDADKKILNTSGLIKKNDYNTNVKRLEIGYLVLLD